MYRSRTENVVIDSNVVIEIRELEISQFIPKGCRTWGDDKLHEHYSGCHVWDGSIVMARWILENQHLFEDKTILELGSGCGLTGIVTSRFAKRVIVSDYLQPVLDNLRFNVRGHDNIQVEELDWYQPEKNENVEQQKTDIIIGSEVTYDERHIAALINVLVRYLKPKSGVFYHILAVDRPFVKEFTERCALHGFDCQWQVLSANVIQDQNAENLGLLIVKST